MSAPLLSQLREPPTAGRFYMVPVVRYNHCGLVDDWPVLGPLHHDKGEVNFPHLHYHLDPRFMSHRQVRKVEAYMYPELLTHVATYPLHRMYDEPPGLPTLARRRCRMGTFEYTPPSRPPWIEKLTARYGSPAEPVRAKGGRLLCPHRKVDLSSFVPDAHGLVTCPLHGLKVRCGAAA